MTGRGKVNLIWATDSLELLEDEICLHKFYAGSFSAFLNISSIFSVTRRSRSDVGDWVSDWLSEWTLADLTDVALVSDDTYGEDEEDE